jgi:hypothetical protein
MKTPAKQEAVERPFDNWIEPESIRIAPHLEVVDTDEGQVLNRPIHSEDDLKTFITGGIVAYYEPGNGESPAFATKKSAKEWLFENVSDDRESVDDDFNDNFASGTPSMVVYIVEGKTISGKYAYLGLFTSRNDADALVESLTGPVKALRDAGILPQPVSEPDSSPKI